MRSYELHQVDAFTNELFGGNPAGVVSNAEGLTDKEMQLIAREMNLSETAFVLPPSAPDADIQCRYFTPEAEIAFCGHATVGALAQLARLKRYGLGGQGTHDVSVETKAGILPMSVGNTDNGLEVSFTAPELDIERYQLQDASFAAKLGVNSELLAEGSEVLIDRALRYLYIQASSLEALDTQVFDFAHIRQQFEAEEIVAFCIYTNETLTEDSNLHARGLAPLVGVDEDPFTGSMQAGLIHAAKHNNVIPVAQETVKTEQGNVVGRPGFATVHHRPHGITVAAKAVPVFSTVLELA